MSLEVDFSKGSPVTVTPGYLLQVRASYQNRFGLQTMNNTGEAVSAREAAAATFPAELKLIKEKGYTIQSKLSIALRPGSSGRSCSMKPTFIEV